MTDDETTEILAECDRMIEAIDIEMKKKSNTGRTVPLSMWEERMKKEIVSLAIQNFNLTLRVNKGDR